MDNFEAPQGELIRLNGLGGVINSSPEEVPEEGEMIPMEGIS